VLIRAVEPVEGIEDMRTRRGDRRDRDLTNGPGKLTEAFDVDDAFHLADLTSAPLYFVSGSLSADEMIATSSRIGISKGVEREWRFFIDGNRFVSPGTPSAQKA
jgi:DNA-3-methyladenine glycosylase